MSGEALGRSGTGDGGRVVGTEAREAARRLRAAGLGGLLLAARRRIEANDAVVGVAVVELGREEQTALADLVGWRRLRGGSGGGRVRVPVAELDAALRQSRFAVGLLGVLEADGGPVVTRRARRAQAEAAWAEQLRRIAAAAGSRAAARRLVEALGGDGPCGRWYRRAYREDAAAAERDVLWTAQAVDALAAGGGGLLAVFAAGITGDPHAFDRGRAAGALLYAALRAFGGPPPDGLGDAEAWSFVLARAGIDTDDVSSTVLAAHLRGARNPVLEAMASAGGGWPLPLGAVRELAFAPAGGRSAFVVENPQVFAHLVRSVGAGGPALVCTSGFLSAAAIRLLDALQAAGYRLWYGGDFDRNGLVIADDLCRRYPGLRLWRMGPADYAAARGVEGGAVLPARDAEWLAALEGPLAATAQAIAAAGVPAYQERLVERLLGDLRGAG